MAQFKEDNNKPDGQAPGLATTKILFISWKPLIVYKKLCNSNHGLVAKKTSNNFWIYIVSIKEGTDVSKLIIIHDLKIAQNVTFSSIKFCKMLALSRGIRLALFFSKISFSDIGKFLAGSLANFNESPSCLEQKPGSASFQAIRQLVRL